MQLDEGSELEKQIKLQVEKTGSLITGEFEEASEAGATRYVLSVYQAVNHLESLCSPLIEDEKTIADTSDMLDQHLKRDNFVKFLDAAEEKFESLTEFLYEEGVL